MDIRALTLICLGTFLFSLPKVSLGHAEVGDVDPYEQVYRYGTLLEKISHLELSSLEMEKAKPAVPYISISGKKIYLNSAFYQATEEVARLYVDEIKTLCPDCVVPTAEEIAKKAEELVAKGWLEQTGQKFVNTIAIRYGGEFIDLGARYGAMAGILKVLGELGEDALLVLFKMPGAHFLCEVITFGISYYSGSVLTIYRTWRNGRTVGKNGFMQLVRLTATSWAAKRALKRIQLEIGPIEMDPDLLDPEVEKSNSKEWIAEEIGDEKRYERFFARVQERVKKYDGAIATEEAKLATANEREIKRIHRQVAYYRKKVAAITKVSRKVFEGRRMGLTFWLFKRNRANTLYSSEPELNHFMRGTQAWMVPLTTTITTPGFSFSNSMQASSDLFWNEISRNQRSLAETDINGLLLEEAREKGVNPENLSSLFTDVEALFDGELSSRVRYNKLLAMQGFVGEFLPNLLRAYLTQIRMELTDREPTSKAYKAVFRLQWNAGRIPYLINMYLDYLRSITLVGNTAELAYQRDLAKDYLVNIFGALEILGQLKDLPDSNRVIEVKDELRMHLRTMNAYNFWIEKKATHSILPVGQTITSLFGLGSQNYFRKKPLCARLYY